VSEDLKFAGNLKIVASSERRLQTLMDSLNRMAHFLKVNTKENMEHDSLKRHTRSFQFSRSRTSSTGLDNVFRYVVLLFSVMEDVQERGKREVVILLYLYLF